MKLDFHVHTNKSMDSIIKPIELALKAKKLGISPCSTDHNTMAAHSELKEAGLEFIPGEEIRTVEGDLIALYLNEVIPKKAPFLEAMDSIREQGAIAYLPHPFDYSRHAMQEKELASKVDAIEIFNARCPFQGYNQKADALANELGKLKSVGSDSHFLFEFGHNYIEVDGEFSDYDDNPKALLKALKNKNIRFVTKKAPFYVRGTTLAVKHARSILRKLNFRIK